MGYIDDPDTQRANIAYIKRSMRQPLLDRARELNLARAWREDGDELALHELVGAYTRLVVSVANRFKNYGLPIGDLIQEGNIGLMQAAARFEPERDVRFSTYANWWIRSAIQDYVLRNWSIVRTGTTASQKALFFNLRRLRARLASGSRAMLTNEDRTLIANELRVNVSEVEAMEVRLGSNDQSLNDPIGEGGGDHWQDFLKDERASPEQTVMGMRDGASRSAWLNEAIEKLPQREQLIIRLRRLSEPGATLEELGRELGVSKERVRQLENRALSRLRESMVGRVRNADELFVEAR